jgi:hypothetical protein
MKWNITIIITVVPFITPSAQCIVYAWTVCFAVFVRFKAESYLTTCHLA